MTVEQYRSARAIYLCRLPQLRKRKSRKPVPPAVEAAVIRRDGMVCRLCGLDAGRAERWWKRIERHCNWSAFSQARYACGWTDGDHRFWQLDHIKAVIDGGRDVASNLRVLCVPCHRAHSGRQSTERAQRRAL